jgi:hypothetical protein
MQELVKDAQLHGGFLSLWHWLDSHTTTMADIIACTLTVACIHENWPAAVGRGP